MAYGDYRVALIQELSRSRSLYYDDNYDEMNLGPEPSPPAIEDQATDLQRESLFDEDPTRYFEERFGDRLNIGQHLFTLLSDQSSRDLLIKLIAYRLLGYRHVKLPRNSPEYWAGIERVIAMKTPTPPLPINWQGLSLAEYDMTQAGFDMRLYAGDTGLACMLVQRQYEYSSPEVVMKAEAGDIVIDAGACWGETTLYFAHEVGPSGSVYSFEFIPSNLAVLKQNLSNNPQLAASVTIVEHPVWREAGLNLYYSDDGPGSYVTPDGTKRDKWDGTVSTVTIDQVVADLNLSSVDLIKMDIEGAELAALKGAEGAIRSYRPKLAISLYHAPEDFDLIPRYIDGLSLAYSYYLGHHTIYQNETVLYCVPDRRP